MAPRLACVLATVSSFISAGFASAPDLALAVGSDGSYNVSIDGTVWLSSSPSNHQICISGSQITLSVVSMQSVSGTDNFGSWTGTSVALASTFPATQVLYTFKSYIDSPAIVVLTASFPEGVNTTGCGNNTDVSTRFPSFDTAAAAAPNLAWLSWKGVTAPSVAGHGLGTMNTNALDLGPAVLYDNSPAARTLTLSTLVRSPW
jgi:hypothetical protein